jgi:hypothetical protein
MMRLALWVCLCGVLGASSPILHGEQRKPARPKARAPLTPLKKTEPPEMICRAELGAGASTGRTFCDVPAAAHAGEGVLLCLPRHRGTATLTFDLHGRHVYSEEQVRGGSAFRRYAAGVVVLTMDNGILGRGFVESEFRSVADLFDRVTTAEGTKAVAPLKPETISIDVPAGITDVAIVGERLVITRLDGADTITQPGRLLATISNISITYEPAPVVMRRR